MTNPETVSIVLPFFRAEKFLAEAIESVLKQESYRDWRLYLIDDGSDEGDVMIAGDYSRRYPEQMEILRHPGRAHLGTSASRNLGIRKARGRLLAFLDADDVWLPHKLAYQVELLDAQREVDWLYGPALRWHSWNGGRDEEVAATIDGFGSDCVAPGEALLKTFLRDEAMTPCTGTVLIRRRALVSCGGFEEEFPGLFDDQVLYAKLCLISKVYVSSNCVSRYRKHADSCCGQSARNGTEAAERERFLGWVRNYSAVATVS